VCNLSNQEAIRALVGMINRYVGNLPSMPGVFPDYSAPVVRNAGDEREMVTMRAGACLRVRAPAARPSRTSATPHRRIGADGSSQKTGAWSQPNSFAGYAPELNPQTKKKDMVWFALNEDRLLFAFAGIWTEFKGDRGTKVQVYPWSAPRRLRLPDDVTQRCGRADPS
jgi:hypothetical protein